MKKTLLVIAIAAALTFAFAASAFAGTSSTYATWDEAFNSAVTGQADESPHQGYVYNTKKCGVCHAVHKGTNGGQLLLRSTAADACTFCHVSSGSGFKQVYGGVVANYNSPDTKFAHNYTCTNCHAVHGAKTMTSAAVKNYILRDLSSSVNTVNGVANTPYRVANAPAAWKTEAVDRNQPISWFCTQCHQYYSDGSANNTTTRYNRLSSVAYETTQMASHPMVAPGTLNYTSAGGRGGTLSAGTTVAFAGSEYCRSCHDAGTDGETATGMNGADFPHFTPNKERFMEAANSVSASNEASSVSTNDGACLKCHADTNTGVGYSF